MVGLSASQFFLVASLAFVAGAVAQAQSSRPIESLNASLESSLVSKIQTGTLTVRTESRNVSIPKETEITGFKCEPFRQFSQSEGIDDMIRVMALKSMRQELSSKGVLITNAQIYALKSISIDQLDNLLKNPKASPRAQELARVILKKEGVHRPNLRLYAEKLKSAQDVLWSRLSPDLKSQLMNEVKNQTGYQNEKTSESQNPLAKNGAFLSKPFVSALEKTLLCFADLQTSSGDRTTVLLPVRSQKLDDRRPVVDVGPSLSKLDADKILVPDQE